MFKEKYNSQNLKYEFIAKQSFSIKNKKIEDSVFVSINENLICPEKIVVEEKLDSFDIFFTFGNDAELIRTKDLLLAEDLFEENKNFICKNSVIICPNKEDLKFYLEFFDIQEMFKIGNILNIVCFKEDVSFYINDLKANNNIAIEEFLNRLYLSDLEKKFIIKNHQDELSGHYDLEPPKVVIDDSLNDKTQRDKNLYTDFMQKDDFSAASFKITEEEKLILNPETIKIVDGFYDPSYEMNKLIGLANVKKELLKLNAKVNFKYDRISRNIYDSSNMNLHMCFFGNPGTGKTTVARIVTSILYNMGYIKKNKCIEINANELKGSKIGETAIKTKVILRNSINKVLFIDEAYALLDNKGGFGQEAVDTIIKEMEDNKKNMVIIFAGYKNEMKEFIKMNEGLKSRISRYIEFENYNTVELCRIFASMLHQNDLKIDTNAFTKAAFIFKEMQLQNNFSNGRFVRNLYEELLEEHAYNVAYNISPNDTITLSDFSDDLMNKLLIQNRSV